MKTIMIKTAKCPACGTEYEVERSSGIRLCPNRKCERPVDAQGNNEVRS